MNRDRELMLRSLDGNLTAEESAELGDRMAASPEFRAELERLTRVANQLSGVAAEGFSDGFADRVMREIWQAREEARAGEGLHGALRWMFVRVAPACGVVALALGLYSGLILDAGMSSSLLETILGLPAESFDMALLLESQ